MTGRRISPQRPPRSQARGRKRQPVPPPAMSSGRRDAAWRSLLPRSAPPSRRLLQNAAVEALERASRLAPAVAFDRESPRRAADPRGEFRLGQKADGRVREILRLV